MPIFEVGRLPPDVHPAFGGPAKEAVVRDVAPDDAVVLVKIDGPFAPNGAGGEALELCPRPKQVAKAGIKPNECFHKGNVHKGNASVGVDVPRFNGGTPGST